MAADFCIYNNYLNSTEKTLNFFDEWVVVIKAVWTGLEWQWHRGDEGEEGQSECDGDDEFEKVKSEKSKLNYRITDLI